MSREKLDPRGSKVGPGRVQSVSELKAFLLRRYPQKMAEHVADDTGISAATIRKWFFRKPQRRPDFSSRQRLARAYGGELAQDAGLPFAVWREAFLFPELLEEHAA